VLTNHHVVGDENIVRVHLSDGTSTSGQVSRLASDVDLALVSVDAVGSTIVPVRLGSYRQLHTGEDVVAIGSSLGVLRNTVTRGIVSAVRRSGGVVYVQTDAAINPGNSGGPLVDLAGEVVGINTAGQGSNSQGIFFAISSDVAQPVANDLVSKGKIDRGFIGIQTHTATAEEAKAENSPTASGTVIDGVQPGTPADKAGLRAGDVIVKLADKDVHNTGDLQQALINQAPGTKVTITFYRGSDKKTLDVTLSTRPDNS
jgi:S1-C subfamily serine protease